MPFESEAQRRFMHAVNPKLAKEFEEKTPKKKKLPAKKKPASKKKSVAKHLRSKKGYA